MQLLFWMVPLLLVQYTVAKPIPTTTCLQPEKHCGQNLCCCNGTIARCSHLGTKLTYIPELPENITSLIFTHNTLVNMSRTSLKNASRLLLTSLDLTYNRIERLEPETFTDFGNLSKLDLSHNTKLDKTGLPLALGRLAKFGELKLTLMDIGLSYLPDDFLNPMNESRITQLILNNNLLTSVDIAVFRHLTFLKQLKLERNLIQTVNATVGHRRLVTLSLMGNEISRHTPSFCAKRTTSNPYPYLVKLYLNQNFISDLTDSSWSCLKSLESIDLGRNVLRTIPNNVFSQLPNLKELRINNMINSNMKLRPAALNSSSLQILKINDNNMNIKRDDVMNNYFKYCPNLITLDTSNNNYKRLDDSEIASFLSPLSNLQNLYMVRCHLHKVPPKLFILMQNLRFLNIDGNGIATLDGIFYGAQTLEKFSAQGNNIKLISATTFPKNVLQTLKQVNLGNNIFECTCNLLWFRTAIGDSGVLPGTNVTLSNWPQRYACRYPSELNGKFLINFRPTEKSCQQSHLILILSSVLGSALVLTFIVTPITYRYRWYIMYWFYRRRRVPDDPERRPLLQDHTPYAYVVYNDEDRAIVHNEFRKLIEEEYGFRLYIWHRDAESGAKAQVMFDGIHGSNHVIAVVSKNFMVDNWCEFQLDVATHRQIELKRGFLTLVVLEDIHKTILQRSWCVKLTRLETVHWCSDTQDIRRRVFEQQIKKILSNTTN